MVFLYFPGKSPLWAGDILPYTTLMYGNGPGHKLINGKRPDIRNVDTSKFLVFLSDYSLPISLTSYNTP